MSETDWMIGAQPKLSGVNPLAAFDAMLKPILTTSRVPPSIDSPNGIAKKHADSS